MSSNNPYPMIDGKRMFTEDQMIQEKKVSYYLGRNSMLIWVFLAAVVTAIVTSWWWLYYLG